jgi:OmpA-OmpF porin, OOP family
VPTYRGLATLGWALEPKPERGTPAAAFAAPVDQDGDGVPDASDECPYDAGANSGCPEATKARPSEVPDAALSAVVVETEDDPYARSFRVGEAVSFEYNSAYIKGVRYPGLHEIRRLLRDHPTLRVRIVGHASDHDRDLTFSPEQRARRNQELSETRARAVAQWLTRRGVARDRLVTEGRGASQPVMSNDSEDNRQKNRRVEVLREPN